MVQIYEENLSIGLKNSEIDQDMRRGVTILEGMGWYSKQPVKVITVVVRKNESISIFRIVKEIDPTAFISQASVIGVYGEGFDVIKEQITDLRNLPTILKATTWAIL